MVPFSTAFEIAAGIRAGIISAEEIVRACLDRVEQFDPFLHAFVSYDADRAIGQAQEIDAARAKGDALGPLAGVPLAVKDNLCTTFGATTCGSQILASFHSRYDAHVVQRLHEAGAILLGKTNLDEFAMGSSTENSAFFTTCNPWDATRVAGGSSGGSAAAVASGMVPASLGSDTGGSIRLPAAFCGVVGLKPTYGRVSRYGLVAFGSSLDQVGPIARDARDAALLLGVVAGHDGRDSTSVPEPVPDYLASLNQPIRGLRIGIREADFGPGLGAEVGTAVHRAIEVFRSNGAEVVPVELPNLEHAVACYYVIASAEASSNLARFDGVHYGHRTPHPKDIHELYSRSRGEGFGAEVKRRIMLGTYALSTGYYDAYYLTALKVRALIRRDFDRAFERVDLLVSPVAPTTAFKIGEKSNDPLAMYLEDIYTTSANLAGVCALSLPAGFDTMGLPIALQLTAPPFAEARLLAAAHQFQTLTDFHKNTPPL